MPNKIRHRKAASERCSLLMDARVCVWGRQQVENESEKRGLVRFLSLSLCHSVVLQLAVSRAIRAVSLRCVHIQFRPFTFRTDVRFRLSIHKLCCIECAVFVGRITCVG